MTASEEGAALSRFNIRTIGPEPPGATPIEEEDLEGLIPDFVATRADLNQVEYENIARHLPVAQRRARQGGPETVLEYAFMLGLHKGMFGDVWRWAGTVRARVANIGVEPYLIAQQSAQLLDDARFWDRDNVFSADERAARIHARLVKIHPFRNGNGRCTRLMGDLYLVSIGEQPFTWAKSLLGVDSHARDRYLTDLLYGLDYDDYSRLIAFARS